MLERPDLAERRIASGLRGDRRLGSKDRPWVADTLYGIVRRRRLLELLLRSQGWRGEAPAEALWWAWMVLARGLPTGDAPVPATWLAGCAEPEQVLASWGHDRADWEWLATVGSLPDWLARGLLEDRDLSQALAETTAQDGRAPVVLRVVAHRGSRAEILAELAAEGVDARPGRWSPQAVRISGRVHLPGLACWKEGRVSLQDEASQVVAALVAPEAGSLVVDACAGAGGKALALAATAPRTVQVVALDVRTRALDEARSRARREGTRLRTQTVRARGSLPLEAGCAARVLVDAPCSGSGTLRRHPGLRWRWDEEAAAAFPAEQTRLLRRYAPLVELGGHLIYATCSLWQAENQEVVTGFLADHPTWVQVPIADVLDEGSPEISTPSGSLAMSPARHDTDGFFAAVLRRS